MHDDNTTTKNREPLTRLALLKTRHQELDDRVDELNAQTGLSPTERDMLKEMKVRKLRLRDAITSLEAEARVSSGRV